MGLKKFTGTYLILFLLLGGLGGSLALAQEGAPPPGQQASPPVATPLPKIDTGDTVWVLASAALVLMMTAPGLALFYGGMVRGKNVLGTIMQSFIILALISVQWVLWGYSLAFGPDKRGLIGGLEWLFLKGVGLDPNPDYAATIPHQAYMIYQAMFAVITPALITGAFAERMKFSTFVVFTLAWATFIYDPLAHWVWGVGGWLRNLGALDFAGGTVVHISSGISALAAALVVGKRKGYGHEPMPPHNLPLTVLGASLLWVGWFGFNAGSALSSGALATSAFVVTNTATAVAALSWMITEWISRGKPTVLGAASGAVAGLVAITPASGFVGPGAAIVIGIGAGYLCYSACNLKTKLGYDDSLDVVGVHGIGGTWGALATGLFASKAINPAGNNGVFFGNPDQFRVQVIAVLATWAFAFVGTLIILKVLDWAMGLRVAEEEEQAGLDLSQHNESGYALGLAGYGEAPSAAEVLEKRKRPVLAPKPPEPIGPLAPAPQVA
ncbi:MAG: ammonium transporter, partial [candidate division NC10 bacterium]|nr:ammonium transporter [candidate division NC10 bacterium]